MAPYFYSAEMKTTAYCGCSACCGWEWGVALGPLPLYMPLPSPKRASGQTTLPFFPRRRFEPKGRGRGGFSAPANFFHEEWVPPGWRLFDRLRGAALGAGVAVTFMLLNRAAHAHLVQAAALQASRYSALSAAGKAGYFGALIGGTFLPVGKYWAETELRGHSYEGVTSTGKDPREYQPPLLSRATLKQGPMRLARRLLTLGWKQRDGTIAADRRVLPYGTRLYIPEYGWGVVDDQGGAIHDDRIDIFISSHERALDWGRRTLEIEVYPVA